MQTFRILSSASSGVLRHQSTAVTTSIDHGAARAEVATDRGITNPIYILSTGALGRPDLVSRSSSRTVTGSAALDDAVGALHRLGDEHGVTGINLSTNPALTGSVEFADAPGVFTSGGPTTGRVGADNLRAIDDAARAVLELVTRD